MPRRDGAPRHLQRVPPANRPRPSAHARPLDSPRPLLADGPTDTMFLRCTGTPWPLLRSVVKAGRPGGGDAKSWSTCGRSAQATFTAVCSLSRPKQGTSCSIRTAAAADREHPAGRAGRLQLTRLDGEHQASHVVDLHLQDVHVGNVEDRIGPGAPARTRITRRVVHRQVFPRSGCFVASDPEGPDALTHGSTRPPRWPRRHAQIRRAP
jgi:hypothetical protein